MFVTLQYKAIYSVRHNRQNAQCSSLLTYLLNYLLTYLITYLLNYLLTYSLTHSLTHSLHGAESLLRR